ncbi:glycosyltransferase family 1 protein [Bacillus tianshenii]|uniref:glycosyltransferase family 1 protein n=1 Tax=Sutcliffiella tianshenii TaxID=1463404 RepID=UPI001CD493FA|nr:glycosyltransferase family 1 protein [Bacillus tianshenii]MCA1320224.1 glycosyltransferase family 1 protein [Bacillus tianshenii]
MGEPIRILHAVVNMNRGGAETLIMNLYRNIDRNKIQFDFLVSNNGVFDDEIISLGGNIYKTPYITDVGPLRYNKNILNFLKAHSEYKIIHCHMDKVSGSVLKIAKKANIPVRIAHSHSSSKGGSILAKIVKNYYGRFIPYVATERFACSNSAAKFLYKDLSSITINNGIKVEDYTYSEFKRNDMRRQLNISDKFVIGHVGRFTEAKNHLFLLDIFKCINENNPNSTLLLVGDGYLKNKIQDKVIELGLSQSVKFLGIKDNVNEILQACDVFLFPSLFEGLGIALIEAQASGLKSITSKDAVPQETSVTNLVEYVSLKESAEFWAKKVLKYENGYERRNTYTDIVKAGFDIKDTADYLQKFYLREVKKYDGKQ